MAKKKSSVRRGALIYLKHRLNPEDLLSFIELKPFTRRWQDLELDDEGDLTALQYMIMAKPKAAQVIEGTAGLRKMRFAPERWNTGKSGAARVLYVYFEAYHVVLLCFVYGKNELDDISADAKKQINKAIHKIEHELQRRGAIK